MYVMLNRRCRMQGVASLEAQLGWSSRIAAEVKFRQKMARGASEGVGRDRRRSASKNFFQEGIEPKQRKRSAVSANVFRGLTHVKADFSKVAGEGENHPMKIF